MSPLQTLGPPQHRWVQGVQHEADKPSPEACDSTAKRKAAGDGVEDRSPELWLLNTMVMVFQMWKREGQSTDASLCPCSACSACHQPAVFPQGLFSLGAGTFSSEDAALAQDLLLHFASDDLLHLPTLLTQSHVALAQSELWEEVSLGNNLLWPVLFPLLHYPTITSPLQLH